MFHVNQSIIFKSNIVLFICNFSYNAPFQYIHIFKTKEVTNVSYEPENGSLSNLNHPKSSVYRKDEGKEVDARTIKVNDIAFPKWR